MKAFADLYEKLDATTGTNAKIDAMATYFKSSPPDDAAWAMYFLTGRRLKRFISPISLRRWTLELTGLSDWLFQESYNAVGDTAECCALLIDALERELIDEDLSLNYWMKDRVLPLTGLDEDIQRAHVVGWWRGLSIREIFILNKLLTGAFRVGVSQSLVARALASVSGLDSAEISHRIMGDWSPSGDWFESLISEQPAERPTSRPYPFFLASPLETETALLGAPDEWQVEWKWDGIRAQLIRRGRDVFIWSRGEELITERFPELVEAAHSLPDGTVIDGEILAARGEKILPFSVLQKRIGRKKLTKSVLEEAPAILMAYDILESKGRDVRSAPLSERRCLLGQEIGNTSEAFRISPLVSFGEWEDLTTERAKSRSLDVEGLMLKRKTSPYQAGRRRGDWWKWKIDPFTVDAVLIYAQAGTGRRASLFTDYTFAVWDRNELVPVAKAYSGLDDEEIRDLDNWIRKNTKDRFGPVRSVEPVHVFEIAFEGINASPHHRSGVALRFPRILRWRHDKRIHDADKLETLKAMIHGATDETAGSTETAEELSASHV